MSDVVVLSMLTGFTTLIGASILLFIGSPGKRLFALYLGLSTGIMTLVIFVDLVPASLRDGDIYGTLLGSGMGVLFLMIVHSVVDALYRNREEIITHSSNMEVPHQSWRKAGWMMTIAIALHHIPEGVAIGAGFEAHEHIGMMIALTMSLHNIPEGIGFAAPLLMGNLRKPYIMLLAVLISLCIPLGAWIGELYFTSTPQAITLGLAFAAGAMGYIVWKEMGPASLRLDSLSAQLGMLLSLAAMIILHYIGG
ncbi:ZIP family metal transporter [Aneurinibacillus terranovensis]|uniref:ZIP family metal transporter n=1 Tax=Aneurinibacillus terranovensis TaxID=278991 RepID=UPI0004022ADA|nr:ZIP family metal transporter [Aneurinibacillus terranovensis]